MTRGSTGHLESKFILIGTARLTPSPLRGWEGGVFASPCLVAYPQQWAEDDGSRLLRRIDVMIELAGI